MRVLVVDIGGTSVKILATGHKTPRKFPSGRTLTPKKKRWSPTSRPSSGGFLWGATFGKKVDLHHFQL